MIKRWYGESQYENESCGSVMSEELVLPRRSTMMANSQYCPNELSLRYFLLPGKGTIAIQKMGNSLLAKRPGGDEHVVKCSLLCVRRPGDAADVLVDGQPIPMVTSYTYLGFPVTANGIDFEEHAIVSPRPADGLRFCVYIRTIGVLHIV